MKKYLGYILLALSFMPWAAVAALPFLGISAGRMAAATTILLISAEVIFAVSLVLLGREAWDKIKDRFRKIIRQSAE